MQGALVVPVDRADGFDVGARGNLPTPGAVTLTDRELSDPGHRMTGERVNDGATQPITVESALQSQLALDRPRLGRGVEEVDGLVDDREGQPQALAFRITCALDGN